MTFAKLDIQKYLVRLDKGEEIVSSIQSFSKTQGIKNAWFTAIGSIENPVLAHYRVDTKKYSEKKIAGIFEITNMTGNVALFENQPLVHPHITISDESMTAFGGHLVSGIVSAAFEMLVTDLGSEFTKSHSEEIGLKLFNLPETVD